MDFVQLSKEDAKEKIKELVKDFSNYTKEELDNKSENQIKSEFIDPLFEALGWDMRKNAEREERVLKGRADYILKLASQKVLVIEAKKTNVKLTEDEGRQAVSYAYHNRIKFAVLTNFKQIRVYHALSNIKNIDKNILMDSKGGLIINCENFEEQFDRLWLLSKESFEKGDINKLLSAKDQRLAKPINESLLDDLLKIREWLSKEIKSKKNYLEQEKIDEIVQILIDRLIFIRSVEDRGLEPKDFLLNLDDDVRNQKVNYQLFPYIKEKFKDFNKKYDSKLFEEGLLDKEGAFSDEVLHKVIRGLYFGTEDISRERYMFDQIPGDLLGSIYEQYLGHILKGTEKRIKLENGYGKRKSMGIYYTPAYIVDYIVKNTVGEYIKDKKIDEILDTKILDPACGSGSFLVRAFEEVCNVIEDKLKKGKFSVERVAFKDYSNRLALYQKITILTNCIYGVDLDEKAVELARLNLLLKLLENEGHETKKLLLPHLENNIKCGNSLIDDAKVSDKAFNWKAQFADVFNQGGFDVVIGNPPYVKSRDAVNVKERNFIQNSGKFISTIGMWDLYIAFVELGLKLLKDKGNFSMIVPDTIGEAEYTQKLTNLILNSYNLYQIDFFPNIYVFENVGIKNKIVFITKNRKINCKRFVHSDKLETVMLIDETDKPDNTSFKFELSKIDLNFKNCFPLWKICYVTYGLRLNSDKADPKKFSKDDLLRLEKDTRHNKIYTEGKYLGRYIIKKVIFLEWGTDRCPKRLVRPTFEELYQPVKLLMSRQKRIATISFDKHICDNTIIVGVPYISLKNVNNKHVNKYIKNLNLNREEVEKISENFDLLYILSIINSKLISYFLKFNSGGKIDTYPDDWKKIPIKIIPLEKQLPFINLVNQMLSLQQKYHSANLSGNEKERLEQQIKNVDYEIDEEVYKLYGITEEEKKIIEESMK